jgi:2-dehydro-3-deoxyphosphogluconate aldolase/(4S)-4-hydroxy-2-oxoglutarate aldolase
MNIREKAVYLTKETGILPAIKFKQKTDLLPYAQAVVDGGGRLLEITMTTPGVLEAFEAISTTFGDRLLAVAGTVLDAATARAAIMAGASVIVSPANIPEVIQTAHRYGVACYIGAYTATEVLLSLEAGADMAKIFPAALAGPAYMTNLRMVYPQANLIPSGGVNRENAAAFIRAGACALSGARSFVDPALSLADITDSIAAYVDIVAKARQTPIDLP